MWPAVNSTHHQRRLGCHFLHPESSWAVENSDIYTECSFLPSCRKSHFLSVCLSFSLFQLHKIHKNPIDTVLFCPACTFSHHGRHTSNGQVPWCLGHESFLVENSNRGLTAFISKYKLILCPHLRPTNSCLSFSLLPLLKTERSKAHLRCVQLYKNSLLTSFAVHELFLVKMSVKCMSLMLAGTLFPWTETNVWRESMLKWVFTHRWWGKLSVPEGEQSIPVGEVWLQVYKISTYATHENTRHSFFLLSVSRTPRCG